MILKDIEKKLDNTFNTIRISKLADLDTKKPSNNDGKYMQIILSKLRTILGNPDENPIMKYEQANSYYFNGDNGLENTKEKYKLILELQDYIVEKTLLPFIYDKYTILKLLQITLNTYNTFIDDANNGMNARDEDICNIFLDIDTMLINDRNTSAENSTKNVKAIDNVNRYKKDSGGYGISSVKDEFGKKDKDFITATVEETQKKLNSYGFAKQIEEK